MIILKYVSQCVFSFILVNIFLFYAKRQICSRFMIFKIDFFLAYEFQNNSLKIMAGHSLRRIHFF